VSQRKIYRTRTFRGGKREAEDALSRFVQEVVGTGAGARDATVGHLIAQWFEFAKDDLSPSTVFGYEHYIRRYIDPALGDVPLDRLRAAQLDQLYAHMRRGGGREGRPLSTATVRQVHALLRRALQQGVKWGWIESNPAVKATPPRVRNRRIEPPNPSDVVRLIEAASHWDPDLGVFLQLSATTGARRGELCGLHWDAIDLSEETMTIARSVVDGFEGSLVEKDTKTHSVRRVALDPTTIGALAAHRERCAARAAACGSALEESAYVFSRAADGAAPWAPNAVTHKFIQIRNRVGLSSVRLHDLRHFAATRLLGAGVPVRTVSGRLGHANAATTLGVYAHFLAESDREAAVLIGDLLDRSGRTAACEPDHKGVHQGGVGQ
jgi:integrase